MGYLWDPKGAEQMAELTIDETAAEAEDVQQPKWELAECTCHDWCERDHELD